jgi:hypothetical protein
MPELILAAVGSNFFVAARIILASQASISLDKRLKVLNSHNNLLSACGGL